jgi:tetratricopeptide (TPR) repeat protein
LATETLAAFRRISADENERTVCLFVLGNAALALHRPADAETHYREVIDRAARNGDSDLIVGSLATAQLAIALGEQGRWAEAETCQRQASAAYLRLLGGAHPFTLMAANNLAWNLHHQGRDAEAEPIARSAVEGCRRSPEIQPSAMIAVLDTLACVCTGLGRAEQAEALFIEIEALEKRLSRPQLIPQVMLNHAETLIRLGKLDDAERRFLAARDLLGESDDTVRDVAGRLAQLKAATEAKQGPVQSNSGEEK